MPNRAPHPCAKPGCAALTHDRYCAEHAHLAGQADRNRGTAHQRGYTAVWQRIRLTALRRDPLCPLCLLLGKTEASLPVHHVDGNPRNCAADNLIAMCKPHHDAITGGSRQALDLLTRALAKRDAQP
jgi:5-methylcytosine-specific restriction protein A